MKDIEIQKRVNKLLTGRKPIGILLREAVLFGRESMRQEAIACVPKKYKPAFATDLFAAGFNSCREQTLSALGEK